MNNFSQFTKVILLVVLSVILFGIFKTFLPEKIFSDSTSDSSGIVIDSLALTINHDSIRTHTELKAFHSIEFTKRLEKRKPILHMPDTLKGYITQKGVIDTLLDPTISIQGYGYLQRIYSKLQALENDHSGKIRIAYYGDSMNDGDFIVQDLRELLQEIFGGNGVGMVSITSMSSGSRSSVAHKHSNNWITQSLVSVRKPTMPFGVDGQVFLANSNTKPWVAYSAGKLSHSRSLPQPKLFYGNSSTQDSSVDITIDGQSTRLNLSPNNSLLNVLPLGVSSAQNIKLTFNDLNDIPIYGVDFSDNYGIYIDNFSLRGNSGLPLSVFHTPLINAFDNVLKYDLIILQYGTNVLNYGSLNYSWYEKSMTGVVQKLQSCYPNADILVISVGDKSSKKNMEMVTDPAVIPLVNAQKRFARENGVGFIDLYNLMGGKNSMVDWVRNGMANKDYTHFNIKGSREIGHILFDEIQKGYAKYKIQQKREQEKLHPN